MPLFFTLFVTYVDKNLKVWLSSMRRIIFCAVYTLLYSTWLWPLGQPRLCIVFLFGIKVFNEKESVRYFYQFRFFFLSDTTFLHRKFASVILCLVLYIRFLNDKNFYIKQN